MGGEEMGKHGGFGWVRDLPDSRDLVFSAAVPTAPLPPKIDLREHCTPIYDQGQLGSCTANAIAAAIDFERIRQGLKPFYPSRLFVYYNERSMEHTIPSDSGAQIRDGIKSVSKVGACSESPGGSSPTDALWPYNVDQFTQQPPKPCYTQAKLDRVLAYMRVPQTLAQLKGCLASGFPFVFGFTVYASFESDDVAKTGAAPMPAPGEELKGGHAVMAVGYDDATQRFIVRNSWGTGWGQHGYFTLPYAYVVDAQLASDFWTMRLVSQEEAPYVHPTLMEKPTRSTTIRS
jgi:C1A family cysteine protease